ncbi:hypothetical protein TUM4438_00340 [Shewanella sairae]|uniref:Uncharacterized protein n=1 Tax=Shewanella sairae TaxID=190310 RepID=A0ABQ4NYN0_9GAMM|nr:hypothetical protein [Shewanella sairae]MCL1131720.1 hypothetical protein [Shewanella sairae]GIU40067.1 hypothetical protein TUM4438_00340 [Shewanella sairae]
MKYLLIMVLLAFSSNINACENIKTAYGEFIKQSFSMNKSFVLFVDDELKVKLTNSIEYIDGTLLHIDENIEFVAEDFKYEEDNTESFLEIDFTCENVDVIDENVIIKSVVDDKSYTSYFLYQNEILVPLKTSIEAEVSVLFMSWDINSIAEYRGFRLL